jgi:YD repeat-containing protein
MKKLKRIIFLLIIINPLMNLYSQNQDVAYPHVSVMTPEAAEFAKYADSPVSYYTGTPNISIPLHEIDVDGFKLPINLNYHASGIRVDQEATWVGLGWSLDVGSRISRAIKGSDDFMKGKFDVNSPWSEKGYYYAPDISVNSENQYRLDGVDSCPAFVGLEYHQIYDQEPDIFYYNLPGMSGKFILDKSRGAVLFDKSHNLKIQIIDIPGSLDVSFKITDKEGNQYFYNQSEITENYLDNTPLNRNSNASNAKYDDTVYDYISWDFIRAGDCGSEDDYQPRPQSPDPLKTSWCLSKIITNTNKEINFTYDSEMQYLPTQESSEKYRFNEKSWSYYYRSKIVNTALRLKSIQWDFGHIDFICYDRFDIKGSSKKLDILSIYNNLNTVIKSYKFDYSYFNNDYSGNKYEHVFKRLKLNKVTEYSGITPLNDGHKFDYFEGSFPAKNSKNVDYWGFQNGKNYGEDYVIGLKFSNISYSGVKKDANFDKAIIGTLKKITYPTGGTAEYKYEPHLTTSGYFEGATYEPLTIFNSTIKDIPVYNFFSINPYPEVYPSSYVHTFQIKTPTTLKMTCSMESSTGQIDPYYDYNITNNPLGRLRKISPSATTLYTYSCPRVYDSGPYAEGSEIKLLDKEISLSIGTYEFIAYTPPRNVQAYWRLFYREDYNPMANYQMGGIRINEIITDAKRRRFRYDGFEMLTQPMLYYFGKRIGIPNYIGSCTVQVSESKTPLSSFNNGYSFGYHSVEEYSWDEEDDTSTIKYNFYNEPESEKFGEFFPDSPSFLIYRNGLIKSIEKFKMYAGQLRTLVEKDEFDYTSTYSNTIKAIRDISHKKIDSDILGYYYKVEWPLKTKLTNTLQTDDGKSIVTETNYTYNTKDLIQSTTYNVGNTQIIEKVKYPFDFSDSVNSALTAKNIIGTPVESITLKNNIVTQATKTEYFNNFGLYLPKTIYKTESDITVSEANYASYYKPVMSFDHYNNKGKLLQFKNVNGPSTYYVWGYNDQYPIAKLENFSVIDATGIQSIITEAVNASNKDASPALENALRKALANLRDAASNAMVTTYTYDPLIGVTSITDPKGYTMYYQYDGFNRLKEVIDADGNIAGKNEYNYKQ